MRFFIISKATFPSPNFKYCWAIQETTSFNNSIDTQDRRATIFLSMAESVLEAKHRLQIIVSTIDDQHQVILRMKNELDKPLITDADWIEAILKYS